MLTKTHDMYPQGAHTSSVSVYVRKINGRILKSLKIVNFYQGMSKLKLKINVKVPQLLCIVVFVALNGEFERFGGFCVDSSIFSRIFLYISNINRHTACMGTLWFEGGRQNMMSFS